MKVIDKDKAYLWDISEACKDILHFISNVNYYDFEQDKMRRFAVERQMLVMGEAANHLSTELIESTKYIPWLKIIGLRNIIAHDYGEILVERIWNTAINHIELLYNEVIKLLES
jgi:uncharacterized protein with HEPN domain